MNRVRVALVAALGALASGCGAHRVPLPTGASIPVPQSEARTVIAQAASECDGVTTMSAVAALGGSIRGQRVRGRLLVGTAPPASVRLELVAPFGQPLFVFVSSAGQASLLLPRENRVLERAADYQVLEAVAGVPLDSAELRAVLLGCVTAASADDVRAYGDRWRSAPAGATGTVYYERRAPGGPWRLAAWVSGERSGRPQRWRAEFSERAHGVPRTVGLYSEGSKAFAITIGLSGVEVNGDLAEAVFELRAPASAAPLSLEDARRSGPMAEQGSRER